MPAWDVRFDLHIDWTDQELLRAVYESQALASVINGIPLPPAIRRNIDRLNIVRAVRGTTGLEGSDLSEAEVAQVLQNPSDAQVLPLARAREEREVKNAGRVMDWVIEQLGHEQDMRISQDTIRYMHWLTTEGLPYEHNIPGQYRRHLVSAGEYVPPREPEEVSRLMDEFERWANSGTVLSWPATVRAIAAHFYFISIHPFGDGNGRTARALESYVLFQEGMNHLGFFSLSNFYYRNREEYIQQLQYARFESGGSLTEFIKFAAKGLLLELELIKAEVLKANKRVAFRDWATETLRKLDPASSKVKSRLEAFMYYLLEMNEPLDERSLRDSKRSPLAVMYAGMNPRTPARDVALLEKLQLIKRSNGLIAPHFEIMDLFMRPGVLSSSGQLQHVRG